MEAVACHEVITEVLKEGLGTLMDLVHHWRDTCDSIANRNMLLTDRVVEAERATKEATALMNELREKEAERLQERLLLRQQAERSEVDRNQMLAQLVKEKAAKQRLANQNIQSDISIKQMLEHFQNQYESLRRGPSAVKAIRKRNGRKTATNQRYQSTLMAYNPSSFATTAPITTGDYAAAAQQSYMASDEPYDLDYEDYGEEISESDRISGVEEGEERPSVEDLIGNRNNNYTDNFTSNHSSNHSSSTSHNRQGKGPRGKPLKHSKLSLLHSNKPGLHRSHTHTSTSTPTLRQKLKPLSSKPLSSNGSSPRYAS